MREEEGELEDPSKRRTLKTVGATVGAFLSITGASGGITGAGVLAECWKDRYEGELDGEVERAPVDMYFVDTDGEEVDIDEAILEEADGHDRDPCVEDPIETLYVDVENGEASPELQDVHYEVEIPGWDVEAVTIFDEGTDIYAREDNDLPVPGAKTTDDDIFDASIPKSVTFDKEDGDGVYVVLDRNYSA